MKYYPDRAPLVRVMRGVVLPSYCGATRRAIGMVTLLSGLIASRFVEASGCLVMNALSAKLGTARNEVMHTDIAGGMVRGPRVCG